MSGLDRFDWPSLNQTLDSQGWAVLPGLFTPAMSREMAALFATEALFRKHVVMARHGYGSGDYKYFAYPLPADVASLRASLYRHLMPLADRWNQEMGIGTRYPASHEDFIRSCHAAGQIKPTPLLLQYRVGDYNCLHQDLYGEHVFPLQMAVLLSTPGQDFSSGEFVLTEQRPRMQSRAHVVPLGQGDGVVFAVSQRPVRGARGIYRTVLRHGVGTIRTGQRHTLGIILHDAA